MKVTGQNNVSKVISTLLTNISKFDKAANGAIITGSGSDYGMGVTVQNPQIAALEKHFSDVPEFEYNSKQENLVINGPLMGGATEELLEV